MSKGLGVFGKSSANGFIILPNRGGNSTLINLPIYNTIVNKFLKGVIANTPDFDSLSTELKQDIYNAIRYVLINGTAIFEVQQINGTLRIVKENKATEGSQNVEFKSQGLLNNVAYTTNSFSTENFNVADYSIAKQLIIYDCLINSLYSFKDRYAQGVLKLKDATRINSLDELNKGKKEISGQMASSTIHDYIVLPDTDSFEYANPDLSGFTSILESVKINLCAVFEIPYTKLFGESASGLNATGEGDRIDWNATLKFYHGQYFRPIFDILKPYGYDKDFSFVDFDKHSRTVTSIRETSEALEIAVLNGFLSEERAREIFEKTLEKLT